MSLGIPSSDEAQAVSGPAGQLRRGLLARHWNPLEALERYGIFLVWTAIVLIFWALRPDTFGTARNLQIILSSQATLLILTLGLLVALSAGEFDLSIGAVMGFGATMLFFFNVQLGAPVLVAVLLVLVLAAFIGLFNGLVTVKLGVPSIVTTLGTATLLAGVLLGLVGPKIQTGLSPELSELFRIRWLGIQLSFYLALALCVAAWYVFEHTPFGRHLYFVGQGREVARLAGVAVDRIRITSLVASAVGAALAGIVLSASTGSAQHSVGTGYLLPAFAAAFLGSTAVIPGQFNAWGSFVAVYMLVTGVSGFQMFGWSGWPEDVFYGASLLAAVILGQVAVRVRRSHRLT